MKPIIRYVGDGRDRPCGHRRSASAGGVSTSTNPWTRDGQVEASVIEIAPRVSGPIVALPIRDNQLVRAGDVLFEIDPRTYQVSLDQARAQLDQTSGNVEAAVEQVESARAGVLGVARVDRTGEQRRRADRGGDRQEQGRVRAAAGAAAEAGHVAEGRRTRPGHLRGLPGGAEGRRGAPAPGRGEPPEGPGRAGRGAGQARRRGRVESAAAAGGGRDPASRTQSRVHHGPRSGGRLRHPPSASDREPRGGQPAHARAGRHGHLLGGRLLQGEPHREHQVRRLRPSSRS